MELTIPGDLTMRSGESTGRQISAFETYSDQSLAVSEWARILAGIIVTAVSSSSALAARVPTYSPLWFGPSKVLQHQDGDETDFAASAEVQQFCRSLLRALENEAVEDGYTHAAEAILQDAFLQFPTEIAEWVEGAVGGTIEWPHRAATLQLLARLRPMDETWRARVIAIGLQSEDVEMRDAAVQAAESWADEGGSTLLREHQETVVWLRDYIERVVKDLEG